MQMNLLRKVSLLEFRAASSSDAVKPTPCVRIGFGRAGACAEGRSPEGRSPEATAKPTARARAGQRGHAPENQRFGGDLAEGNPKGAQAGARASKVLQGNSGELRVAKAKAVVGRGHSSGEAGQCPWMRRASGVKGTMQIKWREQ